MKAIILTAGLGTRFLPMTKSVPKAMLPILGKPVIQYLVEEAVESGVTEVIVVSGRGKRLIEEHFDHSFELAHELKERGKTELLKKVESIEKLARFVFVRQEQARGDGHAILCAKDFLNPGEPVAVLFGDDIIDAPTPALKQLLNIYEQTQSPVLCTQQVPEERIPHYGIVGYESNHTPQAGSATPITELIEKPPVQEAPSNLGIIGKYICTYEVLEHLEKAEASHKDGELRLIDAFKNMLKEGKALHATLAEGQRFDTGNQAGLLQANLAFAMKDPQLKAKIESLLKKLEG